MVSLPHVLSPESPRRPRCPVPSWRRLLAGAGGPLPSPQHGVAHPERAPAPSEPRPAAGFSGGSQRFMSGVAGESLPAVTGFRRARRAPATRGLRGVCCSGGFRGTVCRPAPLQRLRVVGPRPFLKSQLLRFWATQAVVSRSASSRPGVLCTGLLFCSAIPARKHTTHPTSRRGPLTGTRLPPWGPGRLSGSRWLGLPGRARPTPAHVHGSRARAARPSCEWGSVLGVARG